MGTANRIDNRIEQSVKLDYDRRNRLSCLGLGGLIRHARTIRAITDRSAVTGGRGSARRGGNVASAIIVAATLFQIYGATGAGNEVRRLQQPG